MFVVNIAENPSDNIQITVLFIYLFSWQKVYYNKVPKTPVASMGEAYKMNTLMSCHANLNSNAQTAFKEWGISFAQECFTQKFLK